MALPDSQLAAQSLGNLFEAVTSTSAKAAQIAVQMLGYLPRVVRLATIAALPAYSAASGVLTASANAALSVDNVTVKLNDRVLVTPQGAATASDAGVYYVSATGSGTAAWTLTRDVDWATGTVVPSGTLIMTGPEGAGCPSLTFQVTNKETNPLSGSAGILVDTDDPKILAIAGRVLWKARVATVAALATYTAAGGVLTASAVGTQAVDGVTVAVGDRVLLTIGATATDNGLYIVTTKGTASVKFVWTRAPEQPTTYAQPLGTIVEAGQEGTTGPGWSWKSLATTAAPGPVMDTNDPVFYPRTQSGQSAFSASTTKTVANLFVFATTVACVLGDQTTAANTVMKGVLTAGLPGTGQLVVTNANSSSDTFSYLIVNWGG